jgi:hypothetical protein
LQSWFGLQLSAFPVLGFEGAALRPRSKNSQVKITGCPDDDKSL